MSPASGERRRLALVLEYDGSPFAGSQLQKSSPTIQSTLETALRKLTGERLRVAFAGRTDAGVHAKGQVASFTTASRLKTEVFVRGLNAWLPEQVAIRRALEVPESFDPRRHASSRTYRYVIYIAPTRSPLWRDHAWHVPEPLDLARMARAARVLLGEHDFAAFSRREGVTTVRSMQRAEISQREDIVTLEFEANAFLRQQVRRMVGTLVEVGRRRLSAAGFRSVFRQAEPASAGPVAPARGLYLVRVCYPGLDL